MTRAHMMVLVVNEFVPGGWFEFLTQVRLRSDAKFDAEQAQQEAKTADEVILRAKQKLHAYEAEAQAFLNGAAQSLLSEDAKSFMLRFIVRSLQGNQTIEQAAEQARVAAAATKAAEDARLATVQEAAARAQEESATMASGLAASTSQGAHEQPHEVELADARNFILMVVANDVIPKTLLRVQARSLRELRAEISKGKSTRQLIAQPARVAVRWLNG